jgi:hypothetical protein
VTTTPEEADQALEAALELCAEAYDWSGVQSGYLLLFESQMLQDNGKMSTVMGYHAPDHQSWTKTLGILRTGTLRLEHDYVTSD